jgi:hypothetical protein
MVLDASDQVAKLHALDTPPFALDFRRAMCTVPPISSPLDEGTSAHYSNIIKEVGRIEAMYSGSTGEPDEPKPASILRSPKHSKSVEFNSAVSNDGSIISIGSAIEPKFKDNTDVLSLYDVYNSA